MNISDAYTVYLLLLSNAVLLAAAAIAVTRFRKQCVRLEQFWTSATGAAIADRKSEKDRMQLAATIRLERRVSDLQEKLNVLVSKPGKQRASVARHLPIENAVRMAKNGASVEDLTRTCGLNLGEARLLKKMHGKAA